MALHRPGDKPLSEPMMVSLLTHICVTRPRWVNSQTHDRCVQPVFHGRFRSCLEIYIQLDITSQWLISWYNITKFAFTKTRNMWVGLSISRPKCLCLFFTCYEWIIPVCDVDNTTNKLIGFAISSMPFTPINSLALGWISKKSFDDESTLDQLMAWCRQATSHYLSRCWPRFMSP